MLLRQLPLRLRGLLCTTERVLLPPRLWQNRSSG